MSIEDYLQLKSTWNNYIKETEFINITDFNIQLGSTRIKALCPQLFCVFITTAWTSTSVDAIFFLSNDFCLFVQLEEESHVITIVLMTLAESGDNIWICTSVCRSKFIFIPFVETEWSNVPNLSHFPDIYKTSRCPKNKA